jgi:hypothetical protein
MHLPWSTSDVVDLSTTGAPVDTLSGLHDVAGGPGISPQAGGRS